jgi:hypothetical protein
MSPVGTLTRPSDLRSSIRQAVGLGIAAILAVLVMAGVLAFVRGPDFVDHITVDNRSNLEVHVVARDADGTDLGLAVVDPDRRTRLDEVLDQGETWRFQLSRGRDDLGVITMTRRELVDAGWSLVIPASLGRD